MENHPLLEGWKNPLLIKRRCRSDGFPTIQGTLRWPGLKVLGNVLGKQGKSPWNRKNESHHIANDGIAWHSYINHHCNSLRVFQGNPGRSEATNWMNERTFPTQAAKRQLGDCFFGLPKGRHVGVSDAPMRNCIIIMPYEQDIMSCKSFFGSHSADVFA